MKKAKVSSFKRKSEHMPAAKLTMDQAREARARYAAGGISQSQLAAEYGMAVQQMQLLLANKTYKEWQ